MVILRPVGVVLDKRGGLLIDDDIGRWRVPPGACASSISHNRGISVEHGRRRDETPTSEHMKDQIYDDQQT